MRPESSMIARRYRIVGRVQGVGFRAFACDVAESLGVCGWVRNAADGSVEAQAEGDAETLARFEEELRRGPRASRVEGVDGSDAESTGRLGFTVVHDAF